MVVCVGTADAGRWLPQPTGELQNSGPTTHSEFGPQQRAKGCVTAGLAVKAQLVMVLHGVLTVVCSALNLSAHLLIKNSNPTLN